MACASAGTATTSAAANALLASVFPDGHTLGGRRGRRCRAARRRRNSASASLASTAAIASWPKRVMAWENSTQASTGSSSPCGSRCGISSRLPPSATTAAPCRTAAQPSSVVGAKSCSPASVSTKPAESQMTSAAGSSTQVIMSCRSPTGWTSGAAVPSLCSQPTIAARSNPISGTAAHGLFSLCIGADSRRSCGRVPTPTVRDGAIRAVRSRSARRIPLPMRQLDPQSWLPDLRCSPSRL